MMLAFRRYLSPLVIVATTAACGGDDPMALVHGFESGQNQTVVAGATALPNAVTWRLARSSSGQITAERVLDVFVPRAYAQGTTVVKGSPVPGAVVCATDEDGLEPFVPCTNTDANGMASFTFEVTSKVAGARKSEIRGTLEGQPAVFDTAIATILPGTVHPRWYLSANVNFDSVSPRTLPTFAVPDSFGNGVPFRVVPDGRIGVAGDTVGSAAARTIDFSTIPLDVSTWYEAELRIKPDSLVGYFGYRVYTATNGKRTMNWRTYALACGHFPPGPSC